jgi:hypothetical protein
VGEIGFHQANTNSREEGKSNGERRDQRHTATYLSSGRKINLACEVHDVVVLEGEAPAAQSLPEVVHVLDEVEGV